MLGNQARLPGSRPDFYCFVVSTLLLHVVHHFTEASAAERILMQMTVVTCKASHASLGIFMHLLALGSRHIGHGLEIQRFHWISRRFKESGKRTHCLGKGSGKDTSSKV